MSVNNCSLAAGAGLNGTSLEDFEAQDELLVTFYTSVEKLVRFLCFQALGVPVSALGVLGNAVSIAVLTRRSMLRGMLSTNCYLVALSCSDMLYLLILNFGVLTSMWQHVNAEHELEDLAATTVGNDSLASATRSHPFVLAAVNALSNTTIWIVVAFTAERCIAVVSPLRSRILSNPRRAKWTVVATAAIVLLLHGPNFFERDIDTRGETAMAKHPAYRIGYNWGVLLFFFAILPMILLVVLNGLLIRSVARAAVARRNMMLGCSDTSLSATGQSNRGTVLSRGSVTMATQGAEQQRGVTVMLIAIVTIFFLLHAPNAIILISSTYEDYQLNGSSLSQVRLKQRQIADTISNFLIMLSSSVNFLLYTALSRNFRRTLPMLVHPRLRSCARSAQNTRAPANGQSECESTRVTLASRKLRQCRLLRNDSCTTTASQNKMEENFS